MKTHDELMNDLIKSLPDEFGEALLLIASSYPNAQHHEHWVMDQVLRLILGEQYQQFIEAYEAPRGPNGERFVDNWDVGVAP